MDTNDPATKNFHPIKLTWSRGDLISSRTEQLSCHVLGNEQTPTDVSEIIIGRGENIFVGKQDESPLSNSYIVLRNRKTNALRWYRTSNFLMQPYCPESIKKEQNVAVEDQESKRDAISNLNKAMGSKKIKRRVMEAEKINVTTDDLENKLRTALKKEEIVIEKPENISVAEEFPYLPPHDRNASSVEEVYKVSDLLSPDIMDSMNDVAELISKSDVISLAIDNRLTSFFMRCYPCLTRPGLTKIKLLLFADSLMKFLKEPARALKMKKLVVCEYSSSLNAKILDEFCDLGVGNVRQRSASMRDKSFCYILVSLFLALNFVVDLNLFSSIVTSPDFNRIATLMRAVGASKEKGSSTCYILKLPLAELPRVPQGTRISGSFKKKR